MSTEIKLTPSIKTTAAVVLMGTEQIDNIGAMRELLQQHKAGLITVHELAMRVHAETGFTIQTLGADSMTLEHGFTTPLGDVLSTITVDLL